MKRLLICASAALALFTAGCATGGSAANTVAEIEIGYTPIATAAAAAMHAGAFDAATKAELKRLNDVIDTKGPDGERHGLLVNARNAAMKGDATATTVAIAALQSAVAQLAAYEAEKGIKH